MLAKLFKHQMKSVSKILILIHAALLLFGLLLGLAAPGPSIHSNEMSVSQLAFVLSAVLYVFVLVGVCFTVYLLLGIRFYRNMFTSEGYLTHTLPVRPGTLLASHILTFSVWYLISMLTIFLSVVLLVIDAGGGPELVELIRSLPQHCHTSMFMIVIYALQYLIVSAVNCATMIFAAITIGNLFAPHKVIASVVTYIIFYAIIEVTAMILMIASPAMRSMMFVTTTSLDLSPGILKFLIMGEAEAILFSAAFWITSHIILKKHLNLE